MQNILSTDAAQQLSLMAEFKTSSSWTLVSISSDQSFNGPNVGYDWL